MTESHYPVWICWPCGRKYGRRPAEMPTGHAGVCDLCGEKTGVTEPRDFGHLKPEWQQLSQTAALRQAAQDVITRWYSPLWKQEIHTAELIRRLEEALIEAKPVNEP